MVTIAMRFGRGSRRLPMGGQQRGEIVAIGHFRQASEDVAEVSKRILAVAAARDDERVDDRGALSGVGMTNEEPVLFADGRGANGVLDRVVIEFGLPVTHMSAQWFPVVEEVIAGLAEERLGPHPCAQALSELTQPAQSPGEAAGSQLRSPAGIRRELQACLVLVPPTLEPIKPADQLDRHAYRFGRLDLRLDKFAAGVRRM